MAQNGGDAPSSYNKAASPPPPFGRPRHQIKRSISELSSPIRLCRDNTSTPHASATSIGTATSGKSEATATTTTRDARPGPQSASILTRSSFDWSVAAPPQSEGVTPGFTPSGSRRTSILYVSAGEEEGIMPATTAAATTIAATKATKENGVGMNGNGGLAAVALAREQQRAVAHESALRRSLAELETFTTATTTQLNDTCYSFLDKLSALQSTITSLQELAQHAQHLCSTFDSDTRELESDTLAQLDSFADFADQQARIEALQQRVRASREKVDGLSERVDRVRRRVEGWERADRAWQEKTRKRLKAFWVVTSVVAAVLVVAVVAARFGLVPAPPPSPSPQEGSAVGDTATPVVGDAVDGQKVMILDGDPLKKIEGTGDGGMWNNTGPDSRSSLLSQEEEPDVLRVFDEL
ncbi:hypothetical protein VTJ04DRAFT_1108 [Mycothermus thermophilus]|uniref:uncharacterized protein n=1 Tax=Humicola insolens TaxID=85995 RepID=UPI00374217EF